jgi:site-specific DNA-adenine methylase
MGRYKNPLICDASNLENISKALRYSKAAIKVNDYKSALLKAEEGDFIYLDPHIIQQVQQRILQVIRIKDLVTMIN